MGLPAVSKGDPMQGDAIYQKVKQEFGKQPSQITTTQLQFQSDAGDGSSERPPHAIRRLLKAIRKRDEQSTRFVNILQQLEQEMLSDEHDSTPIMDRLKSMERELFMKGTTLDKTASTMDRLRKNIVTALARRLAHVLTNQKEVKEVTRLLRSAVEGTLSAERQETVNSGNRKRALSVDTSTRSYGQPPKFPKVNHKLAEEHMYVTASGDWIFTSAKISPPLGLKFDFKGFMARRKRVKLMRCARKYFYAGRQLFEFHSWQACQAAEFTALETTWQCLDEGHRAEWQDLLSKLHDGQKTALGDAGRSLLQKHDDLHRAAKKSAACKKPSSKVQGMIIDSRNATQERLAEGQSNPSPSTPQYIPTADEAAQQDGLPRNIPWSREEKRVLLKGMQHEWSNERIAAELPSRRRRTPQAVSCAKSTMKRRHPNGLPVIRADTPFPFPPSPTATRQGTSSRVSPDPINFEKHIQRPAQSLPQKVREITEPLQCKRATRSTSASSMIARPTFLRSPTRPPVTAETQDLEYFLLPIDTPECPLSDATEEEVSKACSNAFGRGAGFHSAQNLQGIIWVAAFRRPQNRSASIVSRPQLLNTTIQYRGYHFPPRYLSLRPQRTFIASLAHEPRLVTETLVEAIKAAFSEHLMMPKLALQAMSRPDMGPARKILAQFPQSPGLAQFYIPVLVGPPRRCIHVCFGPVDVCNECWLCKTAHPDGWCDKATKLQYPG